MLKEYLQLETLQQMKILSDPVRVKILWKIAYQSKTGKIIGDELNLQAQKVHYHLKELEKAGLVYIEKTEEKNGIIQKFYRPVARYISINKTFLSSVNMEPSLMTTIQAPIEEALLKIKDIDTSFIETRDAEQLVLNDAKMAVLTIEQTQIIKREWKKLNDLIQSYTEENAAANEGKPYFIQSAAFPIKNDKGEE
ncbi:helix-turn-helix domain-containing protein [Bacillus lacus]|uniref:Helix-turn-helix domain-containing protein n=1 Tax=Metabacillus lacus TaxID=1983721 RepID=A0A7X2J1E7_9BACI|nr:winged helix-turn-helix domain-containing protein [Metabacillus lacus]MRX73556.1 helix-turn-helix domain-containing protein [Metabacillus lacus]